ncbi:uncharacterized protein J3D65DRAFT_394952 [Phyllosticta citribraziliensis]|uniref:Uncharacterized protein n=1 Tax=Phyllosticta citribraziliensis TaxID=989973 RepID=A0ABR1LL49_9PEZI
MSPLLRKTVFSARILYLGRSCDNLGKLHRHALWLSINKQLDETSQAVGRAARILHLYPIATQGTKSQGSEPSRTGGGRAVRVSSLGSPLGQGGKPKHHGIKAKSMEWRNSTRQAPLVVPVDFVVEVVLVDSPVARNVPKAKLFAWFWLFSRLVFLIFPSPDRPTRRDAEKRQEDVYPRHQSGRQEPVPQSTLTLRHLAPPPQSLPLTPTRGGGHFPSTTFSLRRIRWLANHAPFSGGVERLSANALACPDLPCYK